MPSFRTLLFLFLTAAGSTPAADLYSTNPRAFTNGSLTLSSSYLDFDIPNLRSVNATVTSETETLTVSSSGLTPVGFSFSLPLSNKYFTTTVTQYTTPAVITVTAIPPNSSGAQVDLQILTITPTTGPPIRVPLSLEVRPSPPGSPGLTASPSSIAWTWTSGGTTPSASIAVDATSGYSTLFDVVTISDGNWLTVGGGYHTAGSSTPATVSLNCMPGQLPPGTYKGIVNIMANANTYDSNPEPWLVVPVSLTITPAPVASLQSNLATLSFDYQTGAAAPTAQTVLVTSTGAALGFTTTTFSSPAGWLSASANATTTPATVTATVNPAGLVAGPYSGTITLTPSVGAGVTIPVSLTVHGAPTVSASPAALAFTWRQGDPKPAAQVVQVSGSAVGVGFSAQAVSGASWLSVNPASGTAPAAVMVAVDPPGLPPGPYSSSITVSGTAGTSGQTTVAVTLQVTPALPTITRIGNAASYASASVAPGEMVTIFGSGLGPKALAGTTVDAPGSTGTSAGGTQVLFNGSAAPVIYASDGQVAAMAPYGLAGKSSALIQVSYGGQNSNGVTMPVTAAVPGIFTADASGVGAGAIANQDYSPNSATNPADRGSIVVLYLTGEGQTIPGGIDGRITVATAAPPYVPQPVLPVTATVDGQPATVAFYGEAPGIIAGVMQVNLAIPAGARSGNVPVVVNVGDASSQLTAAGAGAVTVSVR